jgi:hypothetical protein
VTDAYAAVEQYSERLLLLGGRLVDPETAGGLWTMAEKRPTTDYNRLLIFVSADEAPHVVRLNSLVLGAIDKAISQLVSCSRNS